MTYDAITSGGFSVYVYVYPSRVCMGDHYVLRYSASSRFFGAGAFFRSPGDAIVAVMTSYGYDVIDFVRL